MVKVEKGSPCKSIVNPAAFYPRWCRYGCTFLK